MTKINLTINNKNVGFEFIVNKLFNFHKTLKIEQHGVIFISHDQKSCKGLISHNH